MKSIKAFIYVLKKSLTEPKYYQDILKTSFWFSLKYLLILNFILMLVGSTIMAIRTLPNIVTRTEPIKREIINFSSNLYPRELIVSINKGQLYTNVNEPYFINPPAFKQWLKQATSSQGDLKNLITIDTKANIEQYQKYQTVFLITKNAVIYPDRQSSLRTYKVTQFSDNLNFNIDYSKYKTFLIKVTPIINSLPRIIFITLTIFILLMPWFGTLFLTIGNLFYLLWVSGLFWIGFKIFKKKITYYQLFRLGMHGITIIILVGALASLLKIDLGIGLFMSFIVWMIFVFKNINFQVNNG